MTLEDTYYVSQIVAVFGVIASLIFVGVQIRQNTKALKATSHHAITDSFNAINTLVLSDPKVARILRIAMAGSDDLDADERMSADYLLLPYFRIFETLYYQYKNGTLDKKLFDAKVKTQRWAVAFPGVQCWWAANPMGLSTEFRAFIDGLIRDARSG